MSGETKKRISDLEVELFEARRDNNFLVGVMSDKPTVRDQFAIAALKNVLHRDTVHTIGQAAAIATKSLTR